MAQTVNEVPVKVIKRKTPEMEALLSKGYGGMTVAKAKAIIKERSENPALWPYEKLEEAQAFLAAYETEPVVVSDRPAWERQKTP